MSELLKINVNGHTEKKNGLTYLSWAWAWAEVLKLDPAATWVAHTYGQPGAEEPCMRVGKTAMVCSYFVGSRRISSDRSRWPSGFTRTVSSINVSPS